MQDFQGRVAVITGGASGIGRALARVLLGEGMKVVIADNSQERIDETLTELTPLGEIIGLGIDVGRGEQVDQLAKLTLERFGKIHLLVSNAGVGGEHGATWEAGLSQSAFGALIGGTLVRASCFSRHPPMIPGCYWAPGWDKSP